MRQITWLDDDGLGFPEVSHALQDPDGLLAAGGDLSVPRLIAAYRLGIFPWYAAGEPILWWSPDPRCVINPGRFKPGRSLARRLRKQDYRIQIDANFAAVVAACRSRPSPVKNRTDAVEGIRENTQSDTWITDDMASAYFRLHQAGYAHSVECYLDGELAGGLYGVCLGNIFCGESMFHRVTDASKIAFAHLMQLMATNGAPLVDCQIPNPHLMSLGATLMPRDCFVGLLQQHLPDTLTGNNPEPANTPQPDWLALAKANPWSNPNV